MANFKINISRKLGEMLVSSSFITQDQLYEALEYQKKSGLKLGQILIEKGYITEKQLLEFLSKQFSIRFIEISKTELNPDIVSLIPESMARRYNLIAVNRENNLLSVAMVDPLNIVVLDELKLMTGYNVEPVFALEDDINSAIDKYYGTKSSQEALDEILKKTQASESEGNLSVVENKEENKDDIISLEGKGEAAPIIKMVLSEWGLGIWILARKDRKILLSFLSVYGIVTGYRLYGKYFELGKIIFVKNSILNDIFLFVSNKIISMILIAFFAQIAVIPVLITSFHKVSLISLFSNLFLIPISAVIMAIVPVGVFLNEYALASDIIFYALKLLTKLFIKLCYLFSSLPYSFVYISFRNELNFVFVSVMIFVFLNLPIINIKSSLARSWIWFIVIGFVFSFMWKDKKFGVFEFENYSVKGYLVLKPQGAYLINPAITAEKIISAAFDSGFEKIDAVMIGSGSAFRKKEIEKIKNVLKVERIYAPLWKCSEDFICVFPKDKADIFEVKFKNDYGYFDDKTKLLFCDEDRCY